jgi:hypothetical protein
MPRKGRPDDGAGNHRIRQAQSINDVHVLKKFNNKRKQQNTDGNRYCRPRKKRTDKTIQKYHHEHIAQVGSDKTVAHEQGNDHFNQKQYRRQPRIGSMKPYAYSIIHKYVQPSRGRWSPF